MEFDEFAQRENLSESQQSLSRRVMHKYGHGIIWICLLICSISIKVCFSSSRPQTVSQAPILHMLVRSDMG